MQLLEYYIGSHCHQFAGWSVIVDNLHVNRLINAGIQEMYIYHFQFAGLYFVEVEAAHI